MNGNEFMTAVFSSGMYHRKIYFQISDALAVIFLSEYKVTIGIKKIIDNNKTIIYT